MCRALRSIDLLDDSVLQQVAASLKDLAQAGSTGDLHRSSRLSLPVGILLYLGISCTQQVRLMFRSTARGFLAGDAAAVALADAKAQEASAFGPHHAEEKLVAFMLASPNGPAFPPLTSIAVEKGPGKERVAVAPAPEAAEDPLEAGSQ